MIKVSMEDGEEVVFDHANVVRCANGWLTIGEGETVFEPFYGIVHTNFARVDAHINERFVRAWRKV